MEAGKRKRRQHRRPRRVPPSNGGAAPAAPAEADAAAPAASPAAPPVHPVMQALRNAAMHAAVNQAEQLRQAKVISDVMTALHECHRAGLEIPGARLVELPAEGDESYKGGMFVWDIPPESWRTFRAWQAKRELYLMILKANGIE
jgi:hypothetical protein